MAFDTFHGEYPAPLVQNDRLQRHRSGSVIVYCSPESQRLAVKIGQYADCCNRYLAELFGDEAPAGHNVYWLARADWLNPPESYGFPYNLGPNAILAAADAELPTQLALIADFMSLDRGGEDVVRMADLLGLSQPQPEGHQGGPIGNPPERTGSPREPLGSQVYQTLTSSTEFFIDYTLGFIMPHEMTHGYCQLRGLPETPRWYYEGVAQWAAYRMQRQMRGHREAAMIYAYYQLLWDRVGDRLPVPSFREADRLGHLQLDTPNYAWYHAGLLRMFRELEERKGSDLLPDLLDLVRREFGGRNEVAHREMIALFSKVVGQDLKTWFIETWNLGG